MPPAERARPARRLPPVNVWGGYAVFVLLIVIFGIAEPDRFLTVSNVQAILELAAIPLLFAVALGVVVIGGEFDLSFAAVAGLTAATVAKVMAGVGLAWPLAVVAALAVGVLVGGINGYAVAYARVPSFIGTLAVSSVAAGIEIALTSHQQIYQGVSTRFVSVVRAQPVLGLSSAVIVAAVIAVVMAVVMRGTVFGRQLDAIGGNAEAAEISGIPVRRRLLTAFVIAGLISGLAGILIVGQSSAYFPDSTDGDLLPAFTAVFVGLAFHPRNQFSVPGAAVGVLLVVVLTNGLIITNQPSWATNVVQGVILLLAVRVSLRSRR